MKDVCIPIPNLEASQNAELELRVAGERQRFNYRLEAFSWNWPADAAREQGESHAGRIQNLRQLIEQYDPKWELVQIYNPGPRDDHIQVLFRQRH